MGAIRISVELAREIGDDTPLQNAYSKYTKEKIHTKKQQERQDQRTIEESSTIDTTTLSSTATDRAKSSKDKKLPLALEASKTVKHQEQLQEYLALSRSRSTVPTWVNDDTINRQPIEKPGAKKSDGTVNNANPNFSTEPIDEDDNASTDSEEYQEIPSTTTRTIKQSKLSKQDNDDDDDEENSRDNDDDMDNDDNDRPEHTGSKSKVVSDLDYLKSKVKKNFDSDDDEEENEDDNNENNDDDMEEENEDVDDNIEAIDDKSVSSSTSPAKPSTHRKSQNTRETETTKSTNEPPSTTESVKKEYNDEPIDLAETGRLFVRNLPYNYTDAPEIILKNYFTKWGPIADIHVPVDTAGKVKGFAYVTYILPEHAVTALAGTDGKIFQGRILHVLPAKPLVSSSSYNDNTVSKIGSQNGGANESSFKRKKEEEKRAGAGNEHEMSNIWNTLFVHTDTVLSATADRLGISKSEVLDRDAKNMAVRVALAETQVIQETKTFLQQEGVNLPTLEQALFITNENSKTKTTGNSTSGVGSLRLPRSDTVMLAKHLPPTADIDSIRELFGRYGVLVRCVLPPSKAIALIEYADNKSAKKAFTSLAYARFQRVPLYLEWAPEGVFVTKVTLPPNKDITNNTENNNSSKENKKRKRDDASGNDAVPTDTATTTTTTKETVPETDEVALPTDGRSLFVKNLSFSTTEEGLRNMFARCGTIRSVRIPKRRNPKYKPDWTSTTSLTSSSTTTVNPSLEWLSMGYGFVEYVNKEDAEKAIRQLQGKMLDDHSLQLKLSTNKNTSNTSSSSTTNTTTTGTTKGSSSSSSTNAEDTSTATKLMVRNLAFEATKGDIQELFSSCGNIKTIRLPKKMDGHHRGFAFIEYLTHAEAASAMSTLASTHLYGRHLVIEWASQTAEHNGVGIASV